MPDSLYHDHVLIPGETQRHEDRIDTTLHNIQSGDWARHQQPGGINSFYDHIRYLRRILKDMRCTHPMCYRADQFPRGMQCGLCEQPLRLVKPLVY